MENRYQIFTVLLNQITRSIHKIKTEQMIQFDLKSAHVSCLYYLYTLDKELTSKELCDACNEDKAHISRALDDLEKKGYITCSDIKAKRYRSPLRLSQKGKEVGKYITSTIENILFKASEGLSLEQRNTMLFCLECISENLNEICKK